MAKELIFSISGNEYGLEPLKLERSKLYGWTEKKVLDDKENECVLGTLVPELSMILVKGGMGLGALNINGEWVEKTDIKYINEDGLDAHLVPSSFDSPIELSRTVPIDELLEHNITSIYSLQGEENHPDFVKTIQEQKEIFTFEFNYRADYEGDPAFVIENEGEIFVLVGKKIEFEYIGIGDEGEIDADDETDEADDDDFDFSMM